MYKVESNEREKGRLQRPIVNEVLRKEDLLRRRLVFSVLTINKSTDTLDSPGSTTELALGDISCLLPVTETFYSIGPI